MCVFVANKDCCKRTVVRVSVCVCVANPQRRWVTIGTNATLTSEADA